MVSPASEAYKRRREELKKQRHANRDAGIRALKAAGMNFAMLNDGHQLLVSMYGQSYDYWPGTGKWQRRFTRINGRGINNLIADIETHKPC